MTCFKNVEALEVRQLIESGDEQILWRITWHDSVTVSPERWWAAEMEIRASDHQIFSVSEI